MTAQSVPITAHARDLLAFEWIKLRSVRSTWVALLAAAAATIATGVLAAVNVKPDRIDHTTFDPVQVSLTGLLIAQLAFGVLGALAITSEHATGLIRTTFGAVPRRRAVLAAKATVVGAVALVAGEFISFTAFFAGQQALASKHLNVSLSDPHVLRAVLCAGYYLFVVALVGLGLGTLIRHTAGTVAVVGMIFVQALIVNLVFPDPNSLAGKFVLLWAGQAISSVRAHVSGYASVADSFGVCTAYAAVAIIAAALPITRRDV